MCLTPREFNGRIDRRIDVFHGHDFADCAAWTKSIFDIRPRPCGQRITLQQCPRGNATTNHPASSAYRKAASISLFACRLRAIANSFDGQTFWDFLTKVNSIIAGGHPPGSYWLKTGRFPVGLKPNLRGVPKIFFPPIRAISRPNRQNPMHSNNLRKKYPY